MARLRILEHVALAEYTTLKIGGPARYLIEVQSSAEVLAALTFATSHALPYIVLGSGSNVFFADTGFAGVVIVMRNEQRTYVEQSDGTIMATIGAGAILDEVIAETTERGWWGLENLSHIPGTVGATPVQNVGAYGVEVASVIAAVEVVDVTTGARRTLTPEDCRFGYRDSVFKSSAGEWFIITAVQYRLAKTAEPRLDYADLQPLQAEAGVVSPERVRAAVIAIRAQKFPDWTTVGTAGSFFKNPVLPTASADALQARYPNLPLHVVSATETKVSLGYILDKICQRKGYRRGQVELSAAQALVLIAHRGATSTEVLDFAAEIAACVYEATGIHITREVRFVPDCA